MRPRRTFYEGAVWLNGIYSIPNPPPAPLGTCRGLLYLLLPPEDPSPTIVSSMPALHTHGPAIAPRVSPWWVNEVAETFYNERDRCVSPGIELSVASLAQEEAPGEEPGLPLKKTITQSKNK